MPENRKQDSARLTPHYFAGIDVGAAQTKVVIIDPQNEIKSLGIQDSGIDFGAAAQKSFEIALNSVGLKKDDVRSIIGTGYGRRNIPFVNDIRTEISCQTKGCFHLLSKRQTIVDIGGQDAKIIKLNEKGERNGFKMNRKCAAGTGTFLEEIAYRLKIPLTNLDGLARQSQKPVELGSYCTVFSSTEIIARIREGVKIEDLVRGLFISVVKRIMEMDSLTDDVVLVGGVVSNNPILKEILEERLKKPVFVPAHPQFTCAYGAALIAQEIYQSQD